MTRLQQLQQFLSDDPSDPFNVYALAIEYQKSDIQKSKELFLELLTEHPKYIPTYYHYGKLLQEMNALKEAQNVFENGIQYAQELNELKALRELRAALQELEEEL